MEIVIPGHTGRDVGRRVGARRGAGAGGGGRSEFYLLDSGCYGRCRPDSHVVSVRFNNATTF